MLHKHFMNAAFLLIIFGIAGCQKSEDPVASKAEAFDTAFLEEGRTIVRAKCMACHSIDSSKASPRPDAPPLSTVLANYNPNALADDFREHMHVGPAEMPDFDFTVKQTEGLLAYLMSIQDSEDGN